MGDRREPMSRGQGNEFLNKLEAAGLFGNLAQEVIDSLGNEKAKQVVKFLRGEFSVFKSNIVPINCFTPFDPAEFLDKGWTIEEEDKRSLKLTELDLTKVQFVTMLKRNELCITGEERLRRLKKSGSIRLDAKIFQTFWENQSLIPESWKEKVDGNIRYIFFDGTILRSPNGNRDVLCLSWYDGKWGWHLSRLDDGRGSYSLSAVLACLR